MGKKQVLKDDGKTYDDFFEAYNDIKDKKTNSTGMGSISNQLTSTFRGYDTGIGKSTYDKNILFDADIDKDDVQGSLNEYRYQQQGWGTQLAAGVARAGVKAATEVAKLPGVIGGIVSAPFVEEGEGYDTAFNNQWVKSLDNINKDINEDLLPVYVGKAIKDGNLWDNITSTSFWATDGADGIGYMLAMMAPGAALNKLGLGAKLLSAGKNAAGILGMTQKTEAAVTALKALGVTGKAVDIGVGAVANTLFESGAEAAGVGNDLDAKKPVIIEGYKNQPDYNQKVLNKLEQLDEQRRLGQISLDQYNKLSSTAQDDVAEEMFKEQRALAMRDTFKSNLAILIIPNLLMSKTLFGKAESNLVREAEKTGFKGLVQRGGQIAKRYGEAFISEGFVEEAGQTTAQNLFTRKAAEGSLQRNGGGFKDFTLGEATEGYIDTISSTEGQKAIFLGGILGGPMMSYQGRKEDVQNRKESNEILSRTGEALDSYNTIFENDIYERNESGGFKYVRGADGRFTNQRVINNANAIKVANALNLKEEESKRFEKAIQEGNQEVVNEIKEKAIFDLITPTIYNGQLGLDALESKLRENEDFQIAQENMNVTKTKKDSEENIKEILDTAKYLQGQNEKFQDFGNDLIRLDDKGSPEDRTDFINALNTQYVKVKYDQYISEKKLKVLESKRSQILNELGLDKSLVLEDELSVKAEENSPLLKQNADQIRKTSESIDKNKKDINELWSGSQGINKSFNQYVNRNEKLREYSSPENVQKTNEIISELKNPNIIDVKDLDKIKNDNKELFTKYPLLEQIYIERTQELINNKKVEIQERQDEKVNEVISTELETPTNGSNSNIPTTNGIPLQELTESIQNDQQVEVEPVSEDEYVPIEDAPIETPQIIDSKDKGAARVISTIQNTGEPIKGLESYVEYEREPRDKTNDKVTFDIGDVMSDVTKEALRSVNTGNHYISNLEELYDNLPIKVNITNGKESTSSYLDAMTSKSSDIVKKETLPLRKAIINAYITNNHSFEGITGKIKNQFPGVLKIEEKIENEPVAKNDIFQLDVFKNMSENQKISYFQNNTAYVNFTGKLLSTVNGKEIIEKGNIDTQNKGEVFLKIPKANGTPFWLKLNTNVINDNQGNDLFELMLLKFRITNGEDISLSQLRDLISTESLQNEISLITKNVEFRVDATVNKLIDLLIFNGNQNPVSKFGLYFKNHTIIGKNGERYEGETGVQVGLLFNKLMNDGNLYRKEITSDDLLENTEYYKDAFLEFFKYKRHNILINNPDFNFKNKNYIKYLLDSVNPILTTNAVINQPTFQGYSNIYLEQSVNNSNIKPTKEEVEDKKIITKSKVNISDGSQAKPVAEIKPSNNNNEINRQKELEDAENHKHTLSYEANYIRGSLRELNEAIESRNFISRSLNQEEVPEGWEDTEDQIISKKNEIEKLNIIINEKQNQVNEIVNDIKQKINSKYDSSKNITTIEQGNAFNNNPNIINENVIDDVIPSNITTPSPSVDEIVENDLEVQLAGLKKLQSFGLDKSKEITETEELIKNKNKVVKEIVKVTNDTNNGKITAEYLDNLADSDIDSYLNTLTNIQNKYPFITNEIMDKGNAEIAEQLKNNVVDIEELKKNCQ